MSMVRRAALLAGLLLLAGCASPRGAAPPVTPSPTPTTTGAPATPPRATPTATVTATPPVRTTTVDVYLVRDAGQRLWVEPVALAAAERTPAAALSLLLDGPAVDDLQRLTPAATMLRAATVTDGVLTVDVSGEILEQRLGGPAEEALQQALAHTGAQFDQVETVRLQVDGAGIDELWGHVDWSEPVAPDPFAVSPIVITEPARGATVPTGDVTVRGTANTFEATVELRLIDPDGQVAEDTFTTATCGTGCRGDWQHTFALPSAGEWTVQATAPDPSGGEGGPPFTTSRTVTAGTG